MKLCAIVVTYYPVIDKAVKNILRYISYVDHLIIWENTPDPDKKNHQINIPEFNYKISYMSTGENVGISFALNKAVNWAVGNDYTHLLTMDQDSYWENFKEYLDFIKVKENEIAYFAPLVNRKSTISPGLFITSGMIVNLQIYNLIGKYCTSFKIDVIDHEFCVRAMNNGISYYEDISSNLVQTFGHSRRTRIFGKEIGWAEYNAYRLEHISRNYIAVLRKYRTPFLYKFNIIKIWVIYPICRIILFEDNKYEKLKAIIKGTISGLFCNNLIRLGN